MDVDLMLIISEFLGVLPMLMFLTKRGGSLVTKVKSTVNNCFSKLILLPFATVVLIFFQPSTRCIFNKKCLSWCELSVKGV